MNILDITERNQQKAWEIVEKTNIIPIWESISARINLVGSLRTGLLMKHRDIDFHIYTSTVTLADSFRAMEKLAESELWQIDMIHIQEGSRYDGYFEKVAERISCILTDETKEGILRLKYETPDSEKIMGIEYYQAVIRDGVQSYPEFVEWRKQHPVTGVVEWMP